MLMKLTGLTFLMLLVGLTSICQETKLVEKKFINSKQIFESYYVIKSDGLTKHGEYVAYFMVMDKYHEDVKNGKTTSDYFIKEKGNYINGTKDGEWIEYSSPQRIKTQGKYLNDKKVGIWRTYKGSVIEQYDYDNNSKLQPIINVYPKYPEIARENDIEGTVVIAYEVSDDCSISNIIVTQSLSPECDKSVLEAMTKYEQLLKEYSVACSAGQETKEFRFTLQ